MQQTTEERLPRQNATADAFGDHLRGAGRREVVSPEPTTEIGSAVIDSVAVEDTEELGREHRIAYRSEAQQGYRPFHRERRGAHAQVRAPGQAQNGRRHPGVRLDDLDYLTGRGVIRRGQRQHPCRHGGKCRKAVQVTERKLGAFPRRAPATLLRGGGQSHGIRSHLAPAAHRGLVL